jgi:uncharacterized protein (TIGR00369 family)
VTEPEQTSGAAIPLHDFLGFTHDVDLSSPGGTAEVRMPVQPEALGFTGNLHGGAIATMVDLTCALAAVREVGFDPERESLITVDMHVRYLGRPRTEVVVARARVVRAGSQLIVIDCQVTDDADHLVAVADFSMMKVARRDPLPGSGTSA